MTGETLFPVMLKEFSNLIKELRYLNTLKITRHQMFFFCMRHTPSLPLKSNGGTIFKGKYFTLMVQQALVMSQMDFLVQIIYRLLKQKTLTKLEF